MDTIDTAAQQLADERHRASLAERADLPHPGTYPGRAAAAVAYDAPTHAEAYAEAPPDLTEEEMAVAAELIDLRLEAPTADVADAWRRTLLLRQAAVDDRRWMASQSGGAAYLAWFTAELLRQFDVRAAASGRPLHTGPIDPDSAEWRGPGGAQAYVRQEYVHHARQAVGAASCPSCGHLRADHVGDDCRDCRCPLDLGSEEQD